MLDCGFGASDGVLRSVHVGGWRDAFRCGHRARLSMRAAARLRAVHARAFGAAAPAPARVPTWALDPAEARQGRAEQGTRQTPQRTPLRTSLKASGRAYHWTFGAKPVFFGYWQWYNHCFGHLVAFRLCLIHLFFSRFQCVDRVSGWLGARRPRGKRDHAAREASEEEARQAAEVHAARVECIQLPARGPAGVFMEEFAMTFRAFRPRDFELLG